ncbi:hypothetical protein MFI1_0707 [Mycoplasmopsis fermentans MF-I1]|nr:hypothetical protein MFI1_0707 [Mycoplasmopsis fermentans MF-I1]
MYKTKYNEDVANSEDAYNSYLEDYALILKYFASNKGFDSSEDAKQYNLDKIKKGTTLFSYYKNEEKLFNPMSLNSQNNFRNQYINNLKEIKSFDNFKYFYFLNNKDVLKNENTIKFYEKYRLDKIAETIYANILNTIFYETAINLKEEFEGKNYLYPDAKDDIGYQFILNPEFKLKGWDYKGTKSIIYKKWKAREWNNFIENKNENNEKELFRSSVDNFEPNDEVVKHFWTFNVHFLGTKIKELLDLKDLEIKTNKFVYDKYYDWWQWLVRNYETRSDFFIGSKFLNESDGLGINTKIVRFSEINNENILDGQEFEIKKNIEPHLSKLVEKIKQIVNQNELDLFSINDNFYGKINGKEKISKKDTNLISGLTKNYKKLLSIIKNEIIVFLNNVIDETFEFYSKVNINNIKMLVKEKNTKNHFLFLNKENVSFYDLKNNVKENILIKKIIKKDEKITENNFGELVNKEEERNFLTFVYFYLKETKSINKELDLCEPFWIENDKYKLYKKYCLLEDLRTFWKKETINFFNHASKEEFSKIITDFYNNKFVPSKKYKFVIPNRNNEIFFNSKELLLANLYNYLKIKNSTNYIINNKSSKKTYNLNFFNVYRFKINEKIYDFKNFNDIVTFFKYFVLQNAKIDN